MIYRKKAYVKEQSYGHVAGVTVIKGTLIKFPDKMKLEKIRTLI